MGLGDFLQFLLLVGDEDPLGAHEAPYLRKLIGSITPPSSPERETEQRYPES